MRSSRTPIVVAVVNQKGGVGKTTTVVNLAAGLIELGQRTLLIDLDPQASLTFSVGCDQRDLNGTTHRFLTDQTGDVDQQVTSLVQAPNGGSCDLLGADDELTITGDTLRTASAAEETLRNGLKQLTADYDVVLIDCSPTLGLLTLNALAAATHVLVPVTCEMLSHRGVSQVLATVADVKRLLNPSLTVSGLLPTMYDHRLAHTRAIHQDLQDRFDVPLLRPIPRSVRVAEAPAIGRSVLATASRTPAAQAYRQLAVDLADQWSLAVP